MKKKYLYIIVLLLLLSFIVSSFVYEAYAIDVGEIFSGENFSMQTGGNEGVNDGAAVAAGIINNAIAIIQIIGLGVAIIMLFSLGIKYMTGSIAEKVEVKKHAVVYVLGAVVFFAATAILEILQMFIKGNFTVE